MATSRKVFINLAVNDLEVTRRFFSKLGFEYDPRFSDENAACMILSEDGYVMLLQKEFFNTFTNRGAADPSKGSEVLLAISCESREEVDRLADIALANGGSPAKEPQEYPFMHVRTFHDPDGHHWELMFMDMEAAEKAMAEQR